MEKRSGSSYPTPDVGSRRSREDGLRDRSCATDFFGWLPDDLVFYTLEKLISSAAAPSDFISILITCKKLNRLGLTSFVLSKASTKSLAIKAKNWSESAYLFLKRCSDAGSTEACYILGMIIFYCLEERRGGSSLMAKAAIGSHAAAMYSLAIIQFNGSGGCKDDKNLRAGVTLCARSAFLGHVDALRELGHCLQDGYGVTQNFVEGRRLLVQANFKEVAISQPNLQLKTPEFSCSLPESSNLLRDFGSNVLSLETHPANQFLVEWFRSRLIGDDLRLCSHDRCGRAETRKHEFRRCSVCGVVNYCSRACQALHWKLAHKGECVSMEQWVHEAGVGDGEAHEVVDGEALGTDFAM